MLLNYNFFAMQFFHLLSPHFVEVGAYYFCLFVCFCSRYGLSRM